MRYQKYKMHALLDRARCSCAIFFNSDDYAHTVGAGNPSVVGSEADIVL
jgi:hypothetical protein